MWIVLFGIAKLLYLGGFILLSCFFCLKLNFCPRIHFFFNIYAFFFFFPLRGALVCFELHSILLNKLIAHDLDGCALCWVESWLNGWAQCGGEWSYIQVVAGHQCSFPGLSTGTSESCLMSLSRSWVKALSAPSACSPVKTLSWAGVLTCWEAAERSGLMDQGQRYGGQQCKVMGPALGQCSAKGLGKSGLRAAQDWQPSDHEPAVCSGDQGHLWHVDLYQE